MFGGYTEVAAYYVNTPWPQLDEYGTDNGDRLPLKYTPKFSLPDPWHNDMLCCDDFIMIAEFSEQEGPKPLILIPKTGGGNFDLNEFSVRLMSVDFQAVAGSSFSISEDTQVIMSEISNGLYAYVHHFTLYDYQARGFVRPFCMSYVTPDQNKLFTQFEEMSTQFRKVAQCFKSGNLDLFVKDLTHYLSDLHYTRERYLEREQSIADVDLDNCVLGDPQEEAILNTITISGLDSMIKEVKGILETTSTILTELEDISPTSDDVPDDMSRSREKKGRSSSPITMDLDNFRYSCSLHNMSPARYWQSTDFRERAASASQAVSNWTDDKDVYKPKLVRTTKKRFDGVLRTLHELCMYGAKAGINKLRSLHKYFSRDLYTLKLEQSDAESMEPTQGLLTVGRVVILNFLDGLRIAQLLEDDDCEISDVTCRLGQKWFSSDTVASFHSAESFISCEEETSPCRGQHCMPQIVLGDTFIKEILSNKNSVAASSCVGTDGSCAGTASSCVGTDSLRHSKPMKIENLSNNSNRSQPDSFCSDPGFLTQGYTSQSVFSSSESCTEANKVGVISSVDHISSFSSSSIGCGLGKLLNEYSAIHQVIFSLLTGRTTVVFGTYRIEKDIRFVVNALALFVPGHSNLSCIEPYHTSPLSIRDLTQFKLVGLCRPERKKLENMVPSSVKSYVTIFDIEKKAVWSPSYNGTVLTEICQQKLSSNDSLLVAHIHSILYDLAVKSFIYFHAFCLGNFKLYFPENDRNVIEPYKRIAYEKKSRNVLAKLSVVGQDAEIIKYFARVVQTQHLAMNRTEHLENNTARIQYTQCTWTKS